MKGIYKDSFKGIYTVLGFRAKGSGFGVLYWFRVEVSRRV